MIPDIRKRVSAVPFVPFAIRTTDDREYPVPTIDHIYLPPGGGRVIVSDDDGVTVLLTGLHVSALIEIQRPGQNVQG